MAEDESGELDRRLWEQSGHRFVSHDLDEDVNHLSSNIFKLVREEEDIEEAVKVQSDFVEAYKFLEGRKDSFDSSVGPDSAIEFLESVRMDYDISKLSAEGMCAEKVLDKAIHLGKVGRALERLKTDYNDERSRYVSADILIPPSENVEYEWEGSEDLEKAISDLNIPGNELWGLSHTLDKNHQDHAEESGSFRIRAGTYEIEDFEEQFECAEDPDGYLWMEFVSEGGSYPRGKNMTDLTSFDPSDSSGLGLYAWDATVKEFGGGHFIYERDGDFVDGIILPYRDEQKEGEKKKLVSPV
ncbi:MAG: hypothetical protein H8Z69_06000 [Nanohaloarchaea archaeon]|nr:hypothetical protein [Candidatus Nanohaloarchaea archaeon]